MTREEQSAHAAEVRRVYEAEKSRILAADYSHKLTFLFNDERVMKDFGSYLSDAGGEYAFIEGIEEQMGLSCSFDYFGHAQEFLGEGVVRVHSEPAESSAE